MNLKNLLTIIISVILLTATLTIVYYSFFFVVKTESSNYSFSVQDIVGLVGDRDAIKFGGIMPGGIGSRFISLRNTFDFPVKIKIKIKGEKSDWISVEENNFVLNPTNAKEIRVSVSVPLYAENNRFYNYTGIIKAYYTRI
ncbi:MAG: hypothetical protein KKF89_03840 [Nanoarchaeota archaeon]|nr:hypothetical protein [Nanoarchaeota archaeon]MBU1854828.1 hypothetical protein [Nanoarchaeota archaeon]